MGWHGCGMVTINCNPRNWWVSLHLPGDLDQLCDATVSNNWAELDRVSRSLLQNMGRIVQSKLFIRIAFHRDVSYDNFCYTDRLVGMLVLIKVMIISFFSNVFHFSVLTLRLQSFYGKTVEIYIFLTESEKQGSQTYT